MVDPNRSLWTRFVRSLALSATANEQHDYTCALWQVRCRPEKKDPFWATSSPVAWLWSEQMP